MDVANGNRSSVFGQLSGLGRRFEKPKAIERSSTDWHQFRLMDFDRISRLHPIGGEWRTG